MNRRNSEGELLEKIVFTALTLTNGERYERDYRPKKPNYQIDIVEYQSEFRFLREMWPMSLLFGTPTGYIEVKKSNTSVSQKEVADIYMKSISLRRDPSCFTVYTNARFVENIHTFLKQLKAEHGMNGLVLKDGKDLTKLITNSGMLTMERKERNEIKRTYKEAIMPFDVMADVYRKYEDGR